MKIKPIHQPVTRTKFAQDFFVFNIAASMILAVGTATLLPEDNHHGVDPNVLISILIFLAFYGVSFCYAYRQFMNLKREYVRHLNQPEEMPTQVLR
jgi:hypothetical protein